MNEKEQVQAQAQAQSPMEKLRSTLQMASIPERPASAVVVELAVERGELCRKIDAIKKAIELDPEQVSVHHKSLWHDQLEAMVSYKNVLSKRIADLMGFDV